MKNVKFYANAFLSLWMVFLVACSTQFVPKSDVALYKGITDTNVKIMELFATVSAGSDSNTCSERLSLYNSSIGSIDALALQSKARPMPENSITKQVNGNLESRGIRVLTGDVAPSANALENVSRQLVKMKEVDCISGLSVSAVELFKNAVIISMDQAITYESFLEAEDK